MATRKTPEWQLIPSVPLDKIDATAEVLNSRVDYREDELLALAQSLKTTGAAPVVKVRPRNGRFEVVDGNRRVMAARLAGLTEVTVEAADLSDEELADVNFAMNLGSVSLSEYEEIRALAALKAQGLTLAALNERLQLQGGAAQDASLLSKKLKLWRELDPSIREGDFRMRHPLAKWRFLHDTVLKAESQVNAWVAVCAPPAPTPTPTPTPTPGDGGGDDDKRSAPSKKQLAVDCSSVSDWMETVTETYVGEAGEQALREYSLVMGTLQYALGLRAKLPLKAPKRPKK